MAKNTMLLLHSQDVCLTMLNCPLLLIQPHRPSCEVRHTDRQETYAVRSRLQGYADILFARTQHCSSAWGEGKLGRSGGGGGKGGVGVFLPLCSAHAGTSLYVHNKTLHTALEKSKSALL